MVLFCSFFVFFNYFSFVKLCFIVSYVKLYFINSLIIVYLLGVKKVFRQVSRELSLFKKKEAELHPLLIELKLKKAWAADRKRICESIARQEFEYEFF